MSNLRPCARSRSIRQHPTFQKLVTGPGAGHPNVPRHFFLRFGLSSAWLPPFSNVAPPISMGTRLPSFLVNSFSNDSNRPLLFCRSILALFLSRQSGGVRSVHHILPASRSSRS